MMVRLVGLLIWLGTAFMATVTAVAILTHTAHWGFEALLLTLLGTALVLALGALTYRGSVASFSPYWHPLC